jgi:urea carboxylase
VIRIADPGPQTTVQDLGRVGHLRAGIPPSGPMDVRAFVIANRLVGNPDGAAGLECTLMGPRFTVEAACAIAGGPACAPSRCWTCRAPTIEGSSPSCACPHERGPRF